MFQCHRTLKSNANIHNSRDKCKAPSLSSVLPPAFLCCLSLRQPFLLHPLLLCLYFPIHPFDIFRRGHVLDISACHISNRCKRRGLSTCQIKRKEKSVSFSYGGKTILNTKSDREIKQQASCRCNRECHRSGQTVGTSLRQLTPPSTKLPPCSCRFCSFSEGNCCLAFGKPNGVRLLLDPDLGVVSFGRRCSLRR